MFSLFKIQTIDRMHLAAILTGANIVKSCVHVQGTFSFLLLFWLLWLKFGVFYLLIPYFVLTTIINIDICFTLQNVRLSHSSVILNEIESRVFFLSACVITFPSIMVFKLLLLYLHCIFKYTEDDSKIRETSSSSISS